MALADRRISTKKIAQTLEISRELVVFIILDVLDMKKLSAKLVPKCLNANQKRDRVVGSQVILEHLRRNTTVFLAQLLTMNETGYICMTQRQKNNLRNGDTVVQLAQKNFELSSQPPS
jgi:predicted kinase